MTIAVVRRHLGLAVLGACLAGIAVPWIDAGALLFDILAPFRNHFAILAPAALAASFRPHRALVLLSAGLIVSLMLPAGLSWLRQTPDLLALPVAERAAVQGPARPVKRIVFINVWERNKDRGRLASFLRSGPADVVVLAELSPEMRPLLKSLLPLYRYQHTCNGRPSCQVAILSRIPLLASGTERATWRHPPLVWVRFAAGHFGDQPLTLLGTHVWRPTRNPMTHRFHMTNITEFASRLRGAVVLAADFNAPVWSGAMRRLQDATGLAPPDCYLPSWPAWPLNAPQFTFDTMLTSHEVSITRMGLGPAVGSDHLPVWADITVHPGIETRCGG